jgi:hypothetical protein
MKLYQLGALLVSVALVSAAPSLLPRQSESSSIYEGSTMNECDGMFASCLFHLQHPGHVAGGRAECNSELSEFAK